MNSKDKTIQIKARGCRAGWPPSLYIIGAQKSGTTFLADALGQHPEIQLSRPKEPGYLAGNFRKGLEWYQQCFSGGEHRILLDASTSYSMAPTEESEDPVASRPLAEVPARMRKLSPDAKIIYVLRNPTNRVYSAYWHNVRAGVEVLPFREALLARKIYLRTSDYMGQIRRYLEYFPSENILIVIFEELKKQPVAETRACCRFVGINDNFDPIFSQKNQGFVFKGPLQQLNRRFSGKGGITPVLKMIAPWVPQKFKNAAGSAIASKLPSMSVEDKNFLDNHFQPMILQLEEFLGRRLDLWT